MARSVAEINQYIVDALVVNFSKVGITIDPTLWSKRNILRLICYTMAVGQALLEQLLDAFLVIVESRVRVSAAASFLWIQFKMFQFQYSDTDPQFVVMINGVPTYPVIDPTLNIITACSVTSSASGIVTIKAAIGSPLGAMSLNQTAAAQGYINAIGTAGIEYDVVSLNPDQIYIDAEIFFLGQFASVIEQNTIDAITNWLQTQSVVNFNGKIKMSDLEGIIRGIQGVDDVTLNNVRARGNSDTFNAGIILILNEQIINRLYSTKAGYMIPETTLSKTLADTLIFTAV